MNMLLRGVMRGSVPLSAGCGDSQVEPGAPYPGGFLHLTGFLVPKSDSGVTAPRRTLGPPEYERPAHDDILGKLAAGRAGS